MRTIRVMQLLTAALILVFLATARVIAAPAAGIVGDGTPESCTPGRRA